MSRETRVDPEGAEPVRECSRPASGRGVTAILHLADLSGPARSMLPRLVATSSGGSLRVVLPGHGTAAPLLEGRADLVYAAYSPLTVPTGAADAVRRARDLLRDVRALRRVLRAERPDLAVVITAVLPSALLACRLERVPTIVYVGELLGVRGGPVLRRWLARALVGATRWLSDAVVCCSDTVAAQFGDADAGTLVETIYPGIDESFAQGDGAALRRSWEIGAQDPCLAVVGNLSPGRGQDVLIRALPDLLARFPRLRCLIVGAPHPRPVDLAYADGLRELVGSLGLEEVVRLVGFLERVEDVYAAADVVVNPATFEEPFGRVAMEALLAGTPVVASDVGAIAEVLHDGADAILVPPGDPAALARAIAGLLSDPGARARLVASGRSRVRRELTEERGVHSFLDVVEAVDASRRPERGARDRSSSRQPSAAYRAAQDGDRELAPDGQVDR